MTMLTISNQLYAPNAPIPDLPKKSHAPQQVVFEPSESIVLPKSRALVFIKSLWSLLVVAGLFFIALLPILGFCLYHKDASLLRVFKSCLLDFWKRRGYKPPAMVLLDSKLEPKGSIQADLALLPDAEESFRYKLRLIRSAKERLLISPNFICPYNVVKIAQELQNTLNENPLLECRLLMTQTTCVGIQYHPLSDLERQFPRRFVFLAIPGGYLSLVGGLHSEDNHVKLIVADQTVIIGSSSFLTDWGAKKISNSLYRPCKELDVIGLGKDLADEHAKRFAILWNFWRHRLRATHVEELSFFPSSMPAQNPEGLCLYRGCRLEVLQSGPEQGEENQIVAALSNQIRKAQHKVMLGTLCFDPSKGMRSVLYSALQKGLSIKGIFNGLGFPFNFSKWFMALKSSPQAFLMSHPYQDFSGLLYHKKCLVTDDLVAIGSFNFGQKSAFYDSELIWLVDSPELADACASILSEDMKKASFLIHRSRFQINWIRHFFPTLF